MKAKARNIYFKNGALFDELDKVGTKEKRSINFLVEEAVIEFLKSKAISHAIMENGKEYRTMETNTAIFTTCDGQMEVPVSPSEDKTAPDAVKIIADVSGESIKNVNDPDIWFTQGHVLKAMTEYGSLCRNKAIEEAVAKSDLDDSVLKYVTLNKFDPKGEPLNEFKRGMKEMRAIIITELKKLLHP